MEQVLSSFIEVLVAVWSFLTALVMQIAPWTPLIAWIGFWLFAVNWVRLRVLMLKGGGIAVVLIGLVMILVWGSVAPQPHSFFGYEISNFVAKTVYVTALFSLMFLCGSVQLSGCCAQCCNFEEPEDAHAAH